MFLMKNYIKLNIQSKFMITNLYVIDHGVSLYSYSISKKMLIDEQMFTGFLSALGAFAQEVFKHGLHSIQIKSIQKLILYLETKYNLLFCAIANEKDNGYIIEKLLSKISESFILKFQDQLESNERKAHKKYREFDDQMSDFLEDRGYPRGIKSLARGLLISGSILFVLVNLLYHILISLNFLLKEVNTLIFMIFWIMIIAFSSALSGYIAGNTKLGSINGILFFLLMTALAFYFAQIYFIDYLLISYILVVICWAMGFTGGYFGDKRKFYPIEE